TESDAKAGVVEELKADGVGLLLVDEDGVVTASIAARNPALVITPDPRLRYGTCRNEVLESIRKFNDGGRKDGLRDMCEMVERLTEEVALQAVRRGVLKLTEGDVKAKDWSSQIDTLESKNACNIGQVPVLITTLKVDLHSFRGARNLLD